MRLREPKKVCSELRLSLRAFEDLALPGWHFSRLLDRETCFLLKARAEIVQLGPFWERVKKRIFLFACLNSSDAKRTKIQNCNVSGEQSSENSFCMCRRRLVLIWSSSNPIKLHFGHVQCKPAHFSALLGSEESRLHCTCAGRKALGISCLCSTLKSA